MAGGLRHESDMRGEGRVGASGRAEWSPRWGCTAAIASVDRDVDGRRGFSTRSTQCRTSVLELRRRRYVVELATFVLVIVTVRNDFSRFFLLNSQHQISCVCVLLDGRALDLQSIGREFKSRPPRCRVQPWASCSVHTHMCFCHQAVLIWYRRIRWEGNRSSGVALAMRHRQ